MCASVCPVMKLLGWIRPGLCAEPSARREAPEPPPDEVQGMDNICRLANRSAATVLAWVRDRDFPAAKVDDCWIADRNQVLEWMKKEVWSCN